MQAAPLSTSRWVRQQNHECHVLPPTPEAPDGVAASTRCEAMVT